MASVTGPSDGHVPSLARSAVYMPAVGLAGAMSSAMDLWAYRYWAERGASNMLPDRQRVAGALACPTPHILLQAPLGLQEFLSRRNAIQCLKYSAATSLMVRTRAPLFLRKSNHFIYESLLTK